MVESLAKLCMGPTCRYKTMDVKNILIETFSHHMLIPLMRSMLWSELDSLLGETVKFHEDYAKEAADIVIIAYRHCNYSKVCLIQSSNLPEL